MPAAKPAAPAPTTMRSQDSKPRQLVEQNNPSAVYEPFGTLHPRANPSEATVLTKLESPLTDKIGLARATL